MYLVRLLYVTNSRIVTYERRKERFVIEASYDTDEEGIANLVEKLALQPTSTTYLLVDTIDEQYNYGNVPHVSRKDRQEVLDRYARRTFRNTSFCYTRIQGRENNGRRDDKVLCTAIVNQDVIKPLLSALQAHRIAVGGIYSLPLISQEILKYLPEKTSHTLLVTRLSTGLRLSFFDNGHLKMSRVTPVHDDSSQEQMTIIQKEVKKTQHYLGRMRLLARDKPITVVIIGDKLLHSECLSTCVDTREIKYIVADILEFVDSEKMDGVIHAETCDIVFAYLLLNKPVANHYASEKDLHHNKMYRIAASLKSASVMSFIGAIVAGIGFGTLALTYNVIGNQAHAQTQNIVAQYKKIENKLPPTPLTSENLRATVRSADRLKKLKTNPDATLRFISKVLSRYSQLQIDRIDWHTVVQESDTMLMDEFNDELFDDSGDEHTAAFEQTDEATLSIKQITTLEGHIQQFDGNYMSALRVLKRLVSSLGNGKVFDQVILRKAPINTNPGERVEGATGFNQKEDEVATFIIDIVVEKQYESK